MPAPLRRPVRSLAAAPTRLAPHPVVPLACDLARSGSNPGTAFFQTEMRQPIYDGCAADRTQAVLLQGFGRSGGLRQTIESPTRFSPQP